MLAIQARIHEKGKFSLSDLMKNVKDKPDFQKAGAITLFIGVVRGRKGIVDVQIHHLLGEFSVGEDLVYVLVAGSHRKNVFPVLEEAVDRYKKEAPIFKKEHITNRKGETTAYWVTEHKAQ